MHCEVCGLGPVISCSWLPVSSLLHWTSAGNMLSILAHGEGYHTDLWQAEGEATL